MSNTTDVRKRKLHSVKRLYKGEGADSHCATCKEKTKQCDEVNLDGKTNNSRCQKVDPTNPSWAKLMFQPT